MRSTFPFKGYKNGYMFFFVLLSILFILGMLGMLGYFKKVEEQQQVLK